jgi:hypothetical protein
MRNVMDTFSRENTPSEKCAVSGSTSSLVGVSAIDRNPRQVDHESIASAPARRRFCAFAGEGLDIWRGLIRAAPAGVSTPRSRRAGAPSISQAASGGCPARSRPGHFERALDEDQQTTTTDVVMFTRPPFGNASRAFITRFTLTCFSCALPSLTQHGWLALAISHETPSPNVQRNRCSSHASTWFTARTSGCKSSLRPTIKSCRVSSAACSADSHGTRA